MSTTGYVVVSEATISIQKSLLNYLCCQEVFIHQCINLAVARGFGRQILEISNFTKGRHLAFVAHNQCSCRLVRLAD